MALRIDIDRKMLDAAITKEVNSLKRAAEKQPNPMVKELLLKDAKIYTDANNTITEIK